jgi:hypothetical protein
MTPLLRRIQRLSATDRMRLVEAVIALTCARLGVLFLPFVLVRRTVDACAMIPARDSIADEVLARVPWAVRAAARRLPFTTTCLVQALAAAAMLQRRGHACSLRFGVRRGGRAGDALDGHAWLEYQGAIVIGAIAELSEYAALS